jgi:uncharacterized protein (UPF0261 family)
MTTQPTVALVGTLDTKGAEYDWIAEQLEALGMRVHVVDAGVREPHGFEHPIDTTQDAVADAAGTTIAALRDGGDRGAAVTAAGIGAGVVLTALQRTGHLDGVIALGGSGGSSIAARAVRDLPVGLPKLIVSTMASGDVSPYVGASDVTMMYSVVDISGINSLSRSILGNAAAAISAMATAHAARAAAPAIDERPLVAASMFGVTTPAVDAARERLEQLGYEVLVFHATGSGGQALESLARSRAVVGVLDLTTTELADDLVGGVLTAGPARLTAAGESGIPQVVSLGALDMVNFGARDTVPAEFEGREFFIHNPTVTLMRTTVNESAELGRRVGAKLAAASGPTVLLVPRGGVSALDAPGQAFADSQADDALFAAVTDGVAGSEVVVIDSPLHINDQEFAVRAADELHALIQHAHDIHVTEEH